MRQRTKESGLSRLNAIAPHLELHALVLNNYINSSKELNYLDLECSTVARTQKIRKRLRS